MAPRLGIPCHRAIDMNPLVIFVLQFLWFTLAWGCLAVLFVVPRLENTKTNTVLSVWIAPHLFRLLGLGLLAPNLAPGMPAAFAVPTAVGDALTACLALACLWALRLDWRHTRALVWVFNVVGSMDLLLAMTQAARLDAVSHLEAQWYVPALGVPLTRRAPYGGDACHGVPHAVDSVTRMKIRLWFCWNELPFGVS